MSCYNNLKLRSLFCFLTTFLLFAKVVSSTERMKQIHEELKPKIGPHIHHFVLTGRPKLNSQDDKKAPSSKSHETFDSED